MAAKHSNNIADKINDLTESLHRTTDVLSSADRMIDHYKDLHREQEDEIAKLQGDIYQINKEKQSSFESELINTLKDSIKKKGHQMTTSDSSEDEFHKRSKFSSAKTKNHRNKVSFNRDNSLSDEDASTRQTKIERNRDQRYRNSVGHFEDNRFANPAHSQQDWYQNKNQMNIELKEIQEKIEEDHLKWKKHKQEMKTMASEMKELKNVIIEATTPKPKQKVSRFLMNEDDDGLEEELKLYKKRLKKEEDTICFLKEELLTKEKEKQLVESTVGEIQSLGNMKSNQMKLLEDQLFMEKQEKQKLIKQLEDLQKKVIIQEKEHSELLIHLANIKTESKTCQLGYEKSLQTIPELKQLLEKSERNRDKYSDYVRKLESEIQTKENTILNLNNQLNEYSTKHSQLQMELQKMLNVADERLQNYIETKSELDRTKEKLNLAECKVKQSETNREELKERALHAIKEYKVKCKRYETEVQEIQNKQKTNELQLSKEISRGKELEVSNLKLQKQYQECEYSMKKLQNDLSECQKTLFQAAHEKSQLQNSLSHCGIETRKIKVLKKSLQELQLEKQKLEKHLHEEKRRRNDIEALLHENYKKSLLNKEETNTLQRQLTDERDNHSHIVSKLTEDHQKVLQDEKNAFEQKITKLLEENRLVENELRFIESKNKDLENKNFELENELTNHKDKFKGVVEKIIRYSEENKSLQHELQAEKSKHKNELNNLHQDLTEEKNRKIKLQNELKEHHAVIEKKKNEIQIIFIIMCRDVENLVNLLTEEEENLLPAKDVPENVTEEYRKRIHELRESLDTCYSISKTLKKRFQQQKLLIRKSHEKTRLQLNEYEKLKKEYAVQHENLYDKLKSMKKLSENERTELQSKEGKIQLLQNRVKELKSHLAECTRALHKSLDVDKDRKTVLQEIDLLKTEHVAHKKIEENFYRCSEKNDVLSAQLNEAKNSLSQLKQDNLDVSLLTSRMIEKFGSGSPSRKKRTFSFDSPQFKSTAVKHLFASESTSQLSFEELQVDTSYKDTKVDPMSMTDKEFSQRFIPNASVEKSNLKKSSYWKQPKEKHGAKKVTYNDD